MTWKIFVDEDLWTRAHRRGAAATCWPPSRQTLSVKLRPSRAVGSDGGEERLISTVPWEVGLTPGWHRSDEREVTLFVELNPLAVAIKPMRRRSNNTEPPAIPRPPARPLGSSGAGGGIGGNGGGRRDRWGGGAAGSGGVGVARSGVAGGVEARRRLPPPDEDGHERDAAATEDAHADPMYHYRDRLARQPPQAEETRARRGRHRSCDSVDRCGVAGLIRRTSAAIAVPQRPRKQQHLPSIARSDHGCAHVGRHCPPSPVWASARSHQL